jgi:DNA-binding CsgD family transcriptional regulator
MTVTAIDTRRQAELLYRTLLGRPRWRVDVLATALRLPGEDVDRMVALLREQGLVADLANEQGTIRAVPRDVTALAARLPDRSPLPGMRPPAEHDGADKACALVERLVSMVHDQVVFLAPDYLPGAAEFATHVAELALSRGVVLRSVWSPEVLAADAAVEHAQWLRRRWAAPRLVATVPCRAVLVDATSGVLFDEHGPQLITSENMPGAMEKLCRAAARLWQLSAEITTEDADHTPAPCRQDVVLRLLAIGLTDDAVARRLGISVRTVRNDVASSMTALAARSRFQAGVRAAQLGLI